MTNKDSVARRMGAGDLAAFAGILRWSVEEGWANFGERAASEDDLRALWEERREVFPYFVGEMDGTVVAAAWASPWKAKEGYAWTAEVSVYVLPEGQGRGLARGLYERLFEVLERQGYRMLIAGVALPNDASVGLHESFGMVKAAHFERNGFKKGAWRDVGYWVKHFGGDEAPEGAVLGVSEVLGDGG